MSDNTIKSTDINPDKAEKKTATKKAAPKKSAAKKEEPIVIPEDGVLIIFESGASYSSNGLRFTRENPIQKVSNEEAEFLLTLDNFRRPDALEVEEYYNSKED